MQPPGPWSDLTRPPLREAALRRALLTPETPWRELTVVAGTGSTNADVAARAMAGSPPGLVLLAEHQSTGRGRLGRAWESPPQTSVLASVLLRPSAPPDRWGWLPLLAGLAVVDVLVRQCGLPARLKWPNDVLVPEHGDWRTDEPRKICGILAEVVAAPEGPAVVLGAGINVSQNAGELPVPTATSLRLAGSAVTERDIIVKAYLRALGRRFADWDAAAGDPRDSGTGPAYREACATIGEPVRVELPTGSLAGLAEGVDDDGRLLVRDDAGVSRPIAAGDVVHARLSTG